MDYLQRMDLYKDVVYMQYILDILDCCYNQQQEQVLLLEVLNLKKYDA